MLTNSKMATALRQISEKDTKEINQYISIEDAKKDVFMSNTKKTTHANGIEVKERFSLSKTEHKFILDIIDSLYVTEEQGGGGRNPAIEKEITRLFGRDVFKEGPTQQFSFLRMAANGVRSFSLKNKKLVIDTGLQTKFGEDCESVIGPFSVIDPGSRSLTGQINLLNTTMTYDYTGGACGLLNMDGYISSIKYENVGGEEPYKFSITFADGSADSFSYSKTRVSTSPVINNSKNYKRNELVKNMFTKHSFLKEKDLDDIREYISTRGLGLQDEIDTFIKNLTFQVWWKEMGDTSFPVWIQSYLGVRAGLTYENTVVGSADWGVIYRSLVNNMACAYQTKTQTTYYPIVKGVYKHGLLEHTAQGKRGRQGGPTERSLKKMLLHELLANNNNVLAILRRSKNIVDANPMFLLKSITEPGWYRYEGEYKRFRLDILQTFMLTLCNTMIQYIKPVMSAIEAELTEESKVNDGLAEFRIKVADYRLKSPFVIFASDQFTIPKYDFQFIKLKIGGSGDHMFSMKSIPILYSDKYVKAELKEPTASQLLAFLNDVYGDLEPVDPNWEEVEEEEEEEEEEEIIVVDEGEGEDSAKKRQRTQGGGGLSQEEIGLYADILKKNKDLPNILLWFVNTYIPEFFPMALAYELASHPTQGVIDSYKPVFSHSILEKILAPFGKVVDGYIEYRGASVRRSGSGSASVSASAGSKIDRNPFVEHACGILRGAKLPQKNMLFKLANGEILYRHEGAKPREAPELLWFIDAIGVAARNIPENDDFALHMRALGYYQQIYDEDVDLCILNKRETASPLEGIQLIRLAADTPKITPRRAVSQEIKEKFTHLVQAIYAKYPDPVKPVKSSLIQKKIALLKSIIGKQTRKRTARRGTKKSTAERRLKMLTRKLHRQTIKA